MDSYELSRSEAVVPAEIRGIERLRAGVSWGVVLFCGLLWLLGAGIRAQGASGSTSEEVAAAPPPWPKPSTVWEARIPGESSARYDRAVEELFVHYERKTGRELQPGPRGRAGLKVFTNAGPGLSTPVPLVRAVVEALQRRGFAREDLFIIDLQAGKLREAGFLPPVSRGGSTFEGVPVYALSSGDYYDPLWFYDSPLPSDYHETETDVAGLPEPAQKDRRSLLPVPLLLEVDFWINLPMVMDHKGVGVSGALANPTLWAVSNNRRFHTNPANAALAAAEIAAIPELWEGWAFTLMTLEKYQFIGSPGFESLYTASEPLLWLSADPVELDARMLWRMNRERRRLSLPELEEPLPLLEYARALDLGGQVSEQAESAPDADSSRRRADSAEPARFSP